MLGLPFCLFFILARIGTGKSQRLARYLHVFGVVSILLACISVVMFQGVGEGFLLHACSHFIFYFTTLLPGFADLLLFLLVLFWIRIREFKNGPENMQSWSLENVVLFANRQIF